jgi:hypothetical protein
VSESRCPSEAELLSFVDLDLSPEKIERVELHLGHCPTCAKQVAELRALILDVAAPLPQEGFDVKGHVRDILQRLDAPLAAEPAPVQKARWAVWSGVVAVAVAAGFALFTHDAERPSGDEFVARGGAEESSLSRDIGVQLYTQSTAVQSLSSGSRIRTSAALTAGLRNLGKEQAYLLLFAVDSKRAVHWIAPEYTLAGSDPAAALITPTAVERLLPSSAVFDDLAAGPLRVYAVITRAPTRVSNVEQMPPGELNAERLLAQFPNAEVRQFMLEVTP